MSDVDEARRTGKPRLGRFREAVLQAARRFKSGWFELAGLLVKVRADNLFEGWGYESFESYCWRELRIRRQTALKLTRSYSFLDKHEPRRKADEEAMAAPAFEVVEALAEAESRGQLSAEDYRDVRDAIWDPDRPATGLMRELAARFPRPIEREDVLSRFARSARKLADDLLGYPRMPRAIRDHASALADELEAFARERQ
jgi:hypothetical protein